VEGATVEPTAAFTPLQLGFVDQTPWRDELIRPRVLLAERTAQPRAQETDTPPDTGRTLRRRFRPQGRRGLLPDQIAVVLRRRTTPSPVSARQEIDRLQALSDGFHDRELARLRCLTVGTAIAHKTVKALWPERAVSCQGHLGLWDYPAQPDRYQARRQVITRCDHGWDQVRMSRLMHGSRPSVDAWIQRVDAEPFAGLGDRSRAPKAPVRKIWLPLLGPGYHRQQAHPDAGEFRLWSLLARSEVAGRPIGRVMALNRLG